MRPASESAICVLNLSVRGNHMRKSRLPESRPAKYQRGSSDIRRRNRRTMRLPTRSRSLRMRNYL
jgi:hypothetical protein